MKLIFIYWYIKYMANDFFSLELGNDFFRLADVEMANNKIKINSLFFQDNTLPIFSNDNEQTIIEEAKIIEKAINNLKIKKNNLNVIIPDYYSYSRIVEMPILKEKELLSAIKYQADQFIPLPLEETTIDLDIIYEDKKENKNLVLIVASSQKLVDKIEKLVQLIGCIPNNLENEISSFSRFANIFFQNFYNKNKIFVNIGNESSTFYFYNQQNSLITEVHSFEGGFNLFLKEIEINLNFDRQKAKETLKTIGFNQQSSVNLLEILKPTIVVFTKELEKFIFSLKERQKDMIIDEIVFFNFVCQIPLLEKELEKYLGIKTSILNLDNFVNQSSLPKNLDNNLAFYVNLISTALLK
ncbi:MAG: pilus assembly protein PilM [Patescibacteria group bacterium]|nr:pilus assembly protein PilM [Patescibacteria group bacterium]